MSYFIDSGWTSLNHVGEELCGDRVESAKNGDWTTLVLADGLGSGVKANILSTLTSKILCTMISDDIPIEDCIDTVLQSLPICKVRGVAYSTFTIIHINNSGKGYLFEFDNPQAILIKNNRCGDLERTRMNIYGKIVYKSDLNLKAGDAILTMSDGVIHAGIGMTLNFGWERDDVIEYMNKAINPSMSARCLACLLASACNDLYMDKPGDDTTVACIKLRDNVRADIMVGPPVDKEKDAFYISRFLEGKGKKIVCGGTSSTIVAKYLNTSVRTEIDFIDSDVPPIGHIDGIDLTTEGVLTLRKLLELSEKYISSSDLTPKQFTKKDGASLLAEMLFEEATDITFYVGQSINTAHLGLPIDITMKLKLVESLTDNLRKMGKNIEVNYD